MIFGINYQTERDNNKKNGCIINGEWWKGHTGSKIITKAINIKWKNTVELV